jgi:hypothetical protein
MEIINLTPHAVNLVDADGNAVATYEPTGTIARAAQTDIKVGEVEVAPGVNVDVVNTSFGEPTDLPDPVEGIYLVVSILTAQAAKAHGRQVDDLLVTSDPVRSSEGRIIGCKRFARV